MSTQLELDLAHLNDSIKNEVKNLCDKIEESWTPQPIGWGMIKGYRQSAMLLKQCAAEWVDNAIDAEATEIHFYFSGKKRKHVEEIIVMDDGCGMNPETLIKSFHIGEALVSKQRKPYECGKFGRGGTIGSLSIAARKETWSRDDEGVPFEGRYYDLEVVKSRNGWDSLSLGTSGLEQEYENLFKEKFGDSTGTILVHKQLDQLTNYDINGIASTMHHFLGETFCQYILSGQLKIFVDRKKVEAKDPLHWQDPDVMKLVDETITLKDGRTFRVKIADLINIHAREGKGSCGYRGRASVLSQGLYFFRSNRLIKGPVQNGDGIQGLKGLHQSYTQFIRVSVEFAPDMDDEFSINWSKNHIEVKRANNVQVSITELVNRTYNPATQRYKARKNSKNSTQRKQLLNRAAKAFNSNLVRPKKKRKTIATSNPTLNGSTNEVKVPKQVKEYIIDEKAYGKYNSSFSLSGNVIIINTDNKFVQEYFMNADEDAQEGFIIDNLADLAAQEEMGEDAEVPTWEQFNDVFVPKRNQKRLSLINLFR